MVNNVIELYGDNNVNLTTYLHLKTQEMQDRNIRPAVVIFPGGGYEFLSEREAEPVALKFAAAGYNAFVLRYTIKEKAVYPQPLADASKAICMIRENADEWGVDPNKIAVCGFSAGGHLAASIGTMWNLPVLENYEGIKIGLNKPNAMILSYPVISSSREIEHKGSIDVITEKESDYEKRANVSAELFVGEHTPPAFIWHTADDGGVPCNNSLVMASALKKFNIPFELHIYQSGVHGLSLASRETSMGNKDLENKHIAGWINLCIEWLNNLFEFDV